MKEKVVDYVYAVLKNEPLFDALGLDQQGEECIKVADKLSEYFLDNEDLLDETIENAWRLERGKE